MIEDPKERIFKIGEVFLKLKEITNCTYEYIYFKELNKEYFSEDIYTHLTVKKLENKKLELID